MEKFFSFGEIKLSEQDYMDVMKESLKETLE